MAHLPPAAGNRNLSAAQVAWLAYNVGGFRGPALQYAVQIMLGESGGSTAARYKNGDGTTDRGLWQFNSYWFRDHPKVRGGPLAISDAAADDPTLATQHARYVWGLQGKSFAPAWGHTFHPEKAAQARAAIAKAIGPGYVPNMPTQTSGGSGRMGEFVAAVGAGLVTAGILWAVSRAAARRRRPRQVLA